MSHNYAGDIPSYSEVLPALEGGPPRRHTRLGAGRILGIPPPQDPSRVVLSLPSATIQIVVRITEMTRKGCLGPLAFENA